MLYYPSRRRLPGTESEMGKVHRMANTIQQLKMCQAFASIGEDVCYVSPGDGSDDPSWETISEYYGLSSRFALKTVPAPSTNYDLPSFPIPDVNDQILTYWLVYAYLSGEFDAGDSIFSRTLRPIRYFLQFREWFGSDDGISVWFEQHQIDRGTSEMVLGDRFYEQLDGLVCISERQKRKIVETQSVDPDKIFVAHDGVDLAAYEDLSMERARERIGLDFDRPVVMYTGHLYPSKGVETLVQAAADFDAHCYIVGGYEEDISRIRSETAVPDNVTFTGFVPPAQIPLYQTAADVLVATVAKDAETDYFSPLKLFEYMAAGKPIVVSRKPEFEEVLTDGENAVFVEPGAVIELAKTVDGLLSEPSVRTELGRQAKDEAKQYDWGVRAQRILTEIRAR